MYRRNFARCPRSSTHLVPTPLYKQESGAQVCLFQAMGYNLVPKHQVLVPAISETLKISAHKPL